MALMECGRLRQRIKSSLIEGEKDKRDWKDSLGLSSNLFLGYLYLNLSFKFNI